MRNGNKAAKYNTSPYAVCTYCSRPGRTSWMYHSVIRNALPQVLQCKYCKTAWADIMEENEHTDYQYKGKGNKNKNKKQQERGRQASRQSQEGRHRRSRSRGSPSPSPERHRGRSADRRQPAAAATVADSWGKKLDDFIRDHPDMPIAEAMAEVHRLQEALPPQTAEAGPLLSDEEQRQLWGQKYKKKT